MPVDEFYLPLNENWPMDHERAYRGGYWIENAYPDSYWAEFRAASRQFARHIAEKGWAETTFEFYLNNKVYFKAERGSWSKCSAPWIFDEPVNTQDFWALRRFGREFLAATGGAGNLVFRCDISRPEWQRDLLDGVCGEEVVSGAPAAVSRPHPGPAGAVRAKGSPLRQSEQDRHSESPVLRLVPGRLVPRRGRRRAVEHHRHRPVVDRAGPNLPVLSDASKARCPACRLKAFCHGQQLVEYLAIFTQLAGHDRRSVAAALRRELGLDGLLKKTSEDDAGTMSYDRLSPAAARTPPLPPWLVDRRPETGRPQVVDPAAAVRPHRRAA